MPLNYKLLGALSAISSSINELKDMQELAGNDFGSLLSSKGPVFNVNIKRRLERMGEEVKALAETLNIAIDECKKEIEHENEIVKS